MNQLKFSCALCGGIVARPWLTKCSDYYLQKGAPADYLECVSCLLIQQFPPPKDLGALYENYPIHTERSAIQRVARRLFQRQVYFRPESGSERLALLDYGCGDGTYLREVQSTFGAVCGFEPGVTHAAALTQHLGVPVYSSAEALCAERADTFDRVTAHYVLEHVADLHGTFETFRTLLRPGGLLYVAVPNIRSWEARLFKHRWHGLDAPRHLVFPEPAHFEKLATRHGFGSPQITFATFPNTLAASLATVVTGRCHPLLLMALVSASWPVALFAPSGTLIARFIKKD